MKLGYTCTECSFQLQLPHAKAKSIPRYVKYHSGVKSFFTYEALSVTVYIVSTDSILTSQKEARCQFLQLVVHRAGEAGEEVCTYLCTIYMVASLLTPNTN